MITWYTQPEKSFASFYSYNEDTREMVRIRMELNRMGDSGDPGDTLAGYRSDHYVGFCPDVLSEFELADFMVDDGVVVHEYHGRLQTEPHVGWYVYDFESTNRKTPTGMVHWGNAVVTKENARLPRGIRERDLRKLARVCFDKQSFILLTPPDATEDELAKSIKAAAGGGIEMKDGGMSIGEKPDAKRPHRRRRRRRTEMIATGGEAEVKAPADPIPGDGIPPPRARKRRRRRCIIV